MLRLLNSLYYLVLCCFYLSEVLSVSLLLSALALAQFHSIKDRWRPVIFPEFYTITKLSNSHVVFKLRTKTKLNNELSIVHLIGNLSPSVMSI